MVPENNTRKEDVMVPFTGRFHREYMPQSGLEIGGTRPTYDIYYASTMEYCVPIV
jgi:hypothetical protein